MERWLPVVGWEDRYEVSDQGRVRSLRFVKINIDRLRSTPLIVKTCLDVNGYPTLSLCRGSKSVTVRVHRLVAAAFLGPRAPGQEVRHLDGDRANPALANLAYGTHVENEADKVVHGTRMAGETHPRAVLTEAQARQILSLYRRGSQTHGGVALARRFGVDRSSIGALVAGDTWASIDRTAYPNLNEPRAKADPALKGVDADCVICGTTFRRPRNRERPITCSAACRSERRSRALVRRHAEGRRQLVATSEEA